jgi:1,5-anhydro-D-fructose reductase (1,5-anhydro-D-mannitol-forming)
MLRYGILGFGGHAVRRLMPGFDRASHSRATGFWRRNSGKAAEVAQKYGLKFFPEPEALCAAPDVDVIFVSSPDAFHLQHVLLALRYKKPVICEKPLAMNAEECRTMLNAADRAGVKFGVAHCFRFETSVQQIRELLKSGDFGPALIARSEFHYMGTQSPRTWIADPQLACGGPIADVGVHCIDTLRFVLQDEVKTVSASATYDAFSSAVEAAGALTLEFSKGLVATVLVSARAEYQTPLSIICQSGHIEADHALTVDFPLNLSSKHVGQETERQTITNYQTYADQVDAFSGWLERGTPFAAPGIEGLKNQLVLDAAYRSIKSGKKETASAL